MSLREDIAWHSLETRNSIYKPGTFTTQNTKELMNLFANKCFFICKRIFYKKTTKVPIYTF